MWGVEEGEEEALYGISCVTYIPLTHGWWACSNQKHMHSYGIAAIR